MRTTAELSDTPPDVFVLDEEVLQLEAQLAKEAGSARLQILVLLAWHIRQRDTRRAMDLAAQAQSLLPHTCLPAQRTQKLRLRLLLINAEAQWLFAKVDAATTILSQAEELAATLHDEIALCDALILRARLATDCGDSSQERCCLQRAISLAESNHDILRLALARGTLAYADVLRDLPLAQKNWGAIYGAECEDLHPVIQVSHYNFQGLVASLSADFGLATSCFMRAHQAAMQSGQLRRAMITANNIGDSFDNLNDHQTALHWMLHGLDLARTTGWPGCIGNSLTQTAQVMHHLGRLDSARQMLEEAMHTMQNFAGSRNHCITLTYMAELELDCGNYQAALGLFRQLREQLTRLAQTDFDSLAWCGEARALSALCQPEQALHAAYTSLQLAQEQHDPLHQISALKILAEIHRAHHLPLTASNLPLLSTGNEGQMLAPSAALHFLLQALQTATQISGYTIPGDLLDAVADAWADLGEHQEAFRLARLANSAREKTHSQQATNRAIALQIKQQTEQAQAEGEYHRQLAEAEARRASALQQTSATLEHLSAIGQEVTAHLEAMAVFQALNRHVHQLLDVSSFAIYLLEENGSYLSRAYGVEAGSALPAGRISLSNPDALSARCVRERREILADNAPNQDQENVIPGTHFSLCSLFAPLKVGERVVGAMTVQSLQRHAYGEREQLIFRTLCAYGAIALDNAHAYAQLQQAQQQLVAQEKLAALGSLVAGVAHELNTPIGNSMIMASALQEQTELIQQQLNNQTLRQSTLQTFVTEAEEAAQLILRGLDLAVDLVGSFKQVAVDRTTAQKRQFDLAQTCHEIVATMMNQIRPGGHEINLEVAPGIIMHSYPGPLGQVLTNLINNSLRHGFENKNGGNMRLLAKPMPGAKVQLQFTDDGHGIASAHLKHVFDPFFTTKMGRGGNGLGLSISYNIVTSLLQGSIVVDSRPGAWTRFTLELPLQTEEKNVPGAEETELPTG